MTRKSQTGGHETVSRAACLWICCPCSALINEFLHEVIGNEYRKTGILGEENLYFGREIFSLFTCEKFPKHPRRFPQILFLPDVSGLLFSHRMDV